MNICCKTVSFCCKKCNSIYNKIIPFHREESYKKEKDEMEDVIKKRFLGARLKELREKNEVYTMDEAK